MPRYIDAYKIRYCWMNTEGKEHDGVTLHSVIDEVPTENVVSRAEADKARQVGYEQGKREIARQILKELHEEILAARKSNFEAIREREIKHNVNRYEDTFCYYCDGKIHALDGIDYFIAELEKKYVGG